MDKHTAEQQLLNLDRTTHLAKVQRGYHQAGVEQADARIDTLEHNRTEILNALAGMTDDCDCPA